MIEQDNHRDHSGDAPQNRPCVAGAGGCLQIGSQAGKTKVARAQHEHLAGHEEKPSPGHRHHGIPDQADRGKGQFHLDETLPPAESIGGGRLAHFLGNALERCVEAESHVPDLAGEDQKDRPDLDSELSAGKQRHHRQHHARQEAEHGDGLQHVEQGNHEALSFGIVGGDISVNQREGEAERISDSNAQKRVSRIGGERPGAARDFYLRGEGPEPCACHQQHSVEQGDGGREHQQIGEIGNFDPGQLRPEAVGRESSQAVSLLQMHFGRLNAGAGTKLPRFFHSPGESLKTPSSPENPRTGREEISLSSYKSVRTAFLYSLTLPMLSAVRSGSAGSSRDRSQRSRRSGPSSWPSQIGARLHPRRNIRREYRERIRR